MAGRLYQARTWIRRAVPPVVLRRVRRIRAEKAARVALSENRRRVEQFGTFDAEDLYRHLSAAISVPEGGVLLVQSSLGHLTNYTGSVEQIVAVLRRLAGPSGTLLMPAHTTFKDEGPLVFDVRRAPAHTGMICEVFRRQPGVMRSLHPTHSVCAKGPLAEELTRAHHTDVLSCGPASPYAKLIEHDGQILGLGLPPVYTTFLHCVEDLDLAAYPRQTYLDRDFNFTIVDHAGERTVRPFRRRDPKLGSTLDLARVAGRLSPEAHSAFHIAGVPMFRAAAPLLFDEMIQLRNQGVILYA